MRFDSAYLRHTAESPAIRAIKATAREHLELGEGGRVLDLGCGPAIDTIALARIVGPSGFVLGVDSDAQTIEEANRSAVSEGVGGFTRHIVGNATAVPWESSQFDACFSERLLQHIPWMDAGKVVSEMVRIVRPAGRVVAVDTDWATLSIACEDPWLERRVVAGYASMFANPFSGRRLPALLRVGGLLDLTVDTYDVALTGVATNFLLRPWLRLGVATGRIGLAEVARWEHSMRTAIQYGLFFAHVAMVMVAGRKS